MSVIDKIRTSGYMPMIDKSTTFGYTNVTKNIVALFFLFK